MEDAFKKLERQHLVSVNFLQHYLQLHFEEPLLNIFTPITVDVAGNTICSGDPGFRDALCERIAQVVRRVSLTPEDSLLITFEDDAKVSISLHPNDYWNIEAISARGLSDDWIAI